MTNVVEKSNNWGIKIERKLIKGSKKNSNKTLTYKNNNFFKKEQQQQVHTSHIQTNIKYPNKWDKWENN